MKHLLERVGRLGILLMCTDFMFVFMTWLLRPSAIKSVGIFLFLFSVLIMTIAVWLEHDRQKRISAAFEEFLKEQNEASKVQLLNVAGLEWKSCIDSLYDKISAQAEQINETKTELLSYREFIEAWVHEIKTPLSLADLLLNNRKDEMSQTVYSRMNYAQRQLNDHVERILYYARLQTEHSDYKFTEFSLDHCVRETVNEYRSFANENRISVQLDLQPINIVSDEKVLHFMISQLLSNACKYADADKGEVHVSSWREKGKVYIAVRNNGCGVLVEDAPFIFDKGFTGNHSNRQKATGMGLYLVSMYAKALCAEIVLDPVSTTGTGFGIELIFSI